MKRETRDGLTRRSLLKATGAAVGASAVASTGVGAQAGINFEGWFDDVQNYDGVTDQRGTDSVTVEVGTDENNGPFAFSPAAVRIDPGTTVTFSWVSNTHNVMVENQPSGANWDGYETIENSGFEYEHTFETEGIYTYFCQPHLSLGMKGAIVVGDVAVGGGGAPGGESPGGEPLSLNSETLLLTGGLLAAFFSPIVFGIYLLVRGTGDDPRAAAAPTWEPKTRVDIETVDTDGPIEEAEPYADVVNEIEHDDFNPVGTGTLVLLYFVLVVLLWIFMYFVEFLGNGPTVIG